MARRISKNDAEGCATVTILLVIGFAGYQIYKFLSEISLVLRIFILIVFSIAFLFIIYLYIRERIKKKKLTEAKLKAINISNIDNMNGHQFEYYVAELLRKRGYKVYLTKGSGDLGVDLVAELAQLRYAVQTKRHSQKVSRSAISDAVAGMKLYNCNKAMVITNNYFHKGAIELAKSNDCILIDRGTLQDWIYVLNNEHPNNL